MGLGVTFPLQRFLKIKTPVMEGGGRWFHTPNNSPYCKNGRRQKLEHGRMPDL